MMKQPHKNIRKADTLNKDFYLNPKYFIQTRDNIFRKAWHWGIWDSELNAERNVIPMILLEDYLDTAVVLSRQASGVKVFSNVCTHRAALVCSKPGHYRQLVCPYHGRQFDLNGQFLKMPGFSEALNFPRDCENLAPLKSDFWGGFHFISEQAGIPFEEWIEPVRSRMKFFPMQDLIPEPSMFKHYTIKAHWALYCDNYLEGFHIPFVHPALNSTIAYSLYRDELFPFGTLQTGFAKPGELAFDLPPDSPDSGGPPVAAYYFWLFPNLMLNFYPWGLSVNIVCPVKPDLTRVEYRGYVCRPDLLHKGAGGDLNQVEMEDEAVVESVQKGIKSALYPGGRFSPEKEPGVHHFHRLLANFLQNT